MITRWPLVAVIAKFAALIPLRARFRPAVDVSDVLRRTYPALLTATTVLTAPFGAVSVAAFGQALTSKVFAVPLPLTSRVIGALTVILAPLKASFAPNVTAVFVMVNALLSKPVPDSPLIATLPPLPTTMK